MSRKKKPNFGDIKKANTRATSTPMEGRVIEDVKAFYNSRRRSDRYEPEWVAMFFEDLLGNNKVDDDVRSYHQTYKTPQVVTRLSGDRWVQEDGFLVGTTSWIFMGRKFCNPIEHRGWIIINRTLSGAAFELDKSISDKPLGTFFMAYSPRHQVGMSALSGNEIGPCRTLEEVKAIIDEEVEATS